MKILKQNADTFADYIYGLFKEAINSGSPAGIYLLKGNNRNTRTRCEICSKLTIKTLGRRQWCSGVSVSIVNFEQVNVGWEVF